ncbi:MAG: hypothetical protein IKN54_07295 [Lachnospiraceae bacterium]|nr:hypothetical protein [Lachnospiraceae bacterium]
MNFETVYRQACDCEPSEQDCSNISKIMEQNYTDVGEAITVAYLCGKNIGKGEAYGK